MGGTSSTLNFTNIKLTERECRTALRDLFDEAAFEDYADPDNMIALDALNAIYQGKTDVFLTHDWGSNRIHHERVAQINQEMKNRGLRTWFASDHPGEDIRKRSIAGMENSSCVVVCITRRYVDAVNTGDGTAGEGFAAEFRHAARTKGIAGIVVVVIDESMRDATQWTGELGMLLGGSPYIDLSSALPAPAPAERMDQLYAAILSVSKLTLGQVLSDSIWKDLVEKKVRSASTMVSSMLAAASVATTSLDPTDTPEPTQASNNASQMAARSLESELQAWMFQHTKIVPKYAERYVAALMDHGIGSQEKLKKKLWRNPHFLIDLGIDEDDAEEIAKALLGEGKEIKATHVDEREYKDLYCWYINARTLGHAGREQLESALADTADHNRSMMAMAMLTVALNGGGGTFNKNLPLSIHYAQEVLPWLRHHASPPTDEELILSMKDQKPYALSVLAASFLSYLIRDGIGTAKDEYTAVRYMKAAAPHGLSLALFLLGFATKMGKGTIRDKAKGVHYYRLAAAQGFPMALVNIGVSYYNGEGVDKDYREAVHYFKIAADKGHARGLFELGTMYYNGEGVPQDYIEAVRLFQQSHDKGYPAATYYLGSCYINGSGLPRDRDRGKQLLQQAAEQGDDDAKVALERLT